MYVTNISFLVIDLLKVSFDMMSFSVNNTFTGFPISVTFTDRINAKVFSFWG